MAEAGPGLPFGHAVLVGTPEIVHDGLQELVRRYRPDELVVTATCPVADLRMQSFELVERIARAL